MKTMEYKTVDMSRFHLSGAGANGESYDCIDDPNLMLKLYNATYPVQPVIDELEIARKAYSIGVPSPEPGEIVQVGDRLGILFRRIVGKRSFSRALADEPERVEEFAKEYAAWCKRLHSIHCPQGLFESQKAQYLKMLDADTALTLEEKGKLRQFILDMPDTDTAVHGDLHMGNIIMTLPVGAPLSTPHEVYFIDLGYFATGCPLLDIAMLQSICLYSDEDFRVKEMHVGIDVTRPFWKHFVDEYFFADDAKEAKRWFGPEVTPDEIEQKMLPWYAVKMLLVEYNIGAMPESYLGLIRAAIAAL